MVNLCNVWDYIIHLIYPTVFGREKNDKSTVTFNINPSTMCLGKPDPVCFCRVKSLITPIISGWKNQVKPIELERTCIKSPFDSIILLKLTVRTWKMYGSNTLAAYFQVIPTVSFREGIYVTIGIFWGPFSMKKNWTWPSQQTPPISFGGSLLHPFSFKGPFGWDPVGDFLGS